jgi:hypothetical protein
MTYLWLHYSLFLIDTGKTKTSNMAHIKLLAWTSIASGFAFGIPERFLNGDYFSGLVAACFLPPLFVIFPFQK